MFVKHPTTSLVYLLVYADDLVLIGPDPIEISKVVQQLQSCVALKDLGKLNLFLGIFVQYTSNRIHICQEKYIIDLLKKAIMQDTRSLPTHISASTILSTHQGYPFEDPSLYRSIVGEYNMLQHPNMISHLLLMGCVSIWLIHLIVIGML